MDDRLKSAGTQLEAMLHRYLEASFAARKPVEGDTTNDSLQNLTLLDRVPRLTLFEQRVQRLKAAAGTLRNCSRVAIPIHRLPPSLLGHIFYKVIASETCMLEHESKTKLPKSQIYLTHVCTHWRQIAIDLPGIWAHIDISPSMLKSKKLLSHLHTFLSRSGQSNLDLHIEYAGEDDGEISSLNNFVAPFISRVQGVACRIKPCWSVPERVFSQSALSCFLNNSTTPGRLTTLEISVKGTSFAFHLQASEQKPDADSLSLDLTAHRLEELLLPITSLRLTGLYPRWASKAYHGLMELRLYTPNKFHKIFEPHLTSILSHSPQLRVFELGIPIEFAETPSTPVKLHNLEALVTHTPSYPQLGRFLRLIDTGSSPLFVSVDSAYEDDELNDNIVHFFTHSNIIRLSTVHFFEFSKAFELVKLAHTVKKFAMKPPPVDPTWSVELNQPIQVHLDALYLLGSMGLDVNQLQGVIDWSGIEKLVVWGHVYRATRDGRPIISEQFLKKELSDLGVLVDMLPSDHDLPSPLDSFLL